VIQFQLLKVFIQKKIGTVKHINRSVLWLHSTTYLKNSGIFVVKGKSCLLAGGQIKDASAATKAAVINATYANPNSNNNSNSNNPLNLLNKQQTGSSSFAKRGSKDPMIGKSVTITKGSFKGLLAHIIDATETQYVVELHGRLKKINVDKSNILITGDRDGAVDKEGKHVNDGIEGWMGIPSTPALTAQTPLHLAETPLYMMGNETPLHGSVTTPNRPDTPGRDNDSYGYDVWKPNALDSFAPPSAQSSTSGWGGSDWRSPQPEPSGWGNVPISTNSTTNNSNNHNNNNSLHDNRSNPEPTGWDHYPTNSGGTSWNHSGASISSASSVASSEPSGWGHLPVNNGIASWDSRSNNSNNNNSNSSSQGYQRSSYYEDSKQRSENLDMGWNAGPSEWESGLIVCFTSTKYIGQEGVLEGKMNSDGTFNVMLKESHERISNILPTQIKLVDPKKRNTVRIMTGSKRGLTGKVKSIDGNDIYVEINGDYQLFRLSQVARVDEDNSYYSNSYSRHGYGRR